MMLSRTDFRVDVLQLRSRGISTIAVFFSHREFVINVFAFHRPCDLRLVNLSPKRRKHMSFSDLYCRTCTGLHNYLKRNEIIQDINLCARASKVITIGHEAEVGKLIALLSTSFGVDSGHEHVGQGTRNKV